MEPGEGAEEPRRGVPGKRLGVLGRPTGGRPGVTGLAEAARRGEVLDLSGGGRCDALSAQAPWGPERDLPAEALLALLTAQEGVHPRGVRVRGARIVGDLDWQWRHLRVPLELTCCRLERPMSLDQATVAGLVLKNCLVPGLSAVHLRSSSALQLGRSIFSGTVRLRDAVVDGDVVLSASTIDATDRHQRTRVALDAHRLQAAGSLALEHGFRALGTVNLTAARIGGSLQGSGGDLVSDGGNALLFADARVGGNVHLSNGFQARGRVTMNRTTVEGNLSCDHATFEHPGGDSLSLNRARIGGGLQMRGRFRSTGRVRLAGARIGGPLDCTDGGFDGGDGDAIEAPGLEVGADVLLCGDFRATGRVQLDGARIVGTLDLDGATMLCPAGQALTASNLTVGADVRFDDEATDEHFTGVGEVRLSGSRIGGSVICAGGTFAAPQAPPLGVGQVPGGPALDLSDTDIGGNLWITQDGSVEGNLRLVRCRIKGDLSFRGVALDGTLSARGMTVDGNFAWVRSPIRPTRVDLRRAQVGQIDDDESSWPDPGGLLVDGFVYERLSTRSPAAPQQRLDWIRRQPGFAPEPYQQLVSVYRRNGQLAEATTVAMAQQDDLRRRGDLTVAARLWNLFLGRTIGHGYRPARVAWALVSVYLVTLVAVWFGADADAFLQTGETAPQPSVTSSRCGPAYPCLAPVAYALESIVPILDLHQRDNWQPRSTTVAERALRDWLYLSTVLGYGGTTLLAAGLSGLARRT